MSEGERRLLRRGNLSSRITDRLLRRSPAARILHREEYFQQGNLPVQRAVRIGVPALSVSMPPLPTITEANLESSSDDEALRPIEQIASEPVSAETAPPKPARLTFDEMTAILQRNTEAWGASRSQSGQLENPPAPADRTSLPPPSAEQPTTPEPVSPQARRVARSAHLQELPAGGSPPQPDVQLQALHSTQQVPTVT